LPGGITALDQVTGRPTDVNAYAGIDPQVLEGITGGNAELAEKIIQRYLTTAGPEIEMLPDLAAKGDRAALRRQAHRVLGAAATVGAVDVEAAARKLEEALAEGSDEPLLSSLVQRVTAAFGAMSGS